MIVDLLISLKSTF